VLLSWKAQVSRRPEAATEGLPRYRPLEVPWLLELVRVSAPTAMHVRAIRSGRMALS